MYDSFNEPQIPAEIRELVHRSFDEPISDHELQAIEAALEASIETRRWYCRMAQLHADLTVKNQTLELCRHVQAEKPEFSQPNENRNHTKPRSSRSRWLPRALERFPFGAAASILVIGLGLGCGMGLLAATIVYVSPKFTVAPWNWNVGNDVIAKVVSTEDVKWQDSKSPETLPTQGLRVGQKIRLERGLIHLRYRSGVDLIVKGPSVFEIRSEHGGKLYSGSLSITCSTESATFNVDTPVGLLQIGPGRFGVETRGSEIPENAAQETSVHAISSTLHGEFCATFTGISGEVTHVIDGEALRFSIDTTPELISLDSHKFPQRLSDARGERFAGHVIPLGNLFDDSKNVSLNDAIATDSFQAAGETIDLGVCTVHDGGLDVDVLLAEDGVLFNLANVGGGGPRVRGLPGNDCYRSTHSVPIRTTGEDFIGMGPAKKVEDGIGMSANELITFDLDELRRAGKLDRTTLRFVADRAGINDRDFEDKTAPYLSLAKVNMVAIVSTNNQVLSAHVNGAALNVTEHSGVFSIVRGDQELPRPLNYDGKFANFDILIPPSARFLTLATTMVGDEDCDHAVFSGARLELLSPAGQARRIDN